MALRTWLVRNEPILKAAAAIVVAVVASLWAVVELLYTDAIKPRLLPGKLSTEILSREVERTDRYTAHEVTFAIKNVGVNRVYVPSSHFAVRAVKISKFIPAIAQPKTEEERVRIEAAKELLQKQFDSMPPEKAARVKSQAQNHVFKRRWAERLEVSAERSGLELRAPYYFDAEDSQFVHFARITGLNTLLDPGDIAKAQVLVIVPVGFDAIEVTSQSQFSKDPSIGEKYAFFAVPDERHGIITLALARTKNLPDELKSLRETVAKRLQDGFFEKVDADLKAANVMRESGTAQFAIARSPNK